MEKNSFNSNKPIIFIPARKGSKGVPFKNQILLRYTLETIPDEFRENVIVSSDDDKIFEICKKYQIKFDERKTELAEDETSIKDVLLDFINKSQIPRSRKIVMLYLTYPERSWIDISNAYNFFILQDSKSMLCKKIPNTHPYLMMFKNGDKGKQIVKHDLYRRQEYPDVFEISHYIAVFLADEVKNLNKNLYNKDTNFFQISNKIDIDTVDDLKQFDSNLGKKRILILGNDKTLNDLKDVEFKDDVLVVGINRAHEILKTDYTFFSDFKIFAEIYKKDKGDLKKIKNHNLIASDWIFKHGKDLSAKQWEQRGLIKIHNRKNKVSFPDSITVGIEYFNKLFNGNATFYVYGVSLTHDNDENHFWTNERPNKELGKNWYEPRYLKTFENFKSLKKQDVDIVSVSKTSQINKIFEYQNVDELIKLRKNSKENILDDKKNFKLKTFNDEISLINKINNINGGYKKIKYLFDLVQLSDNFIKSADVELEKKLSNIVFNGIDLFNFKSLIKGKSIAVVANSSKLLENNFGESIDKHDIVIRFNSYKILPKHTGSKITMHVSIYLQDINLEKNVPIRCIISNSYTNWVKSLNNLTKTRQGLILKYNAPSTLFGKMKLTQNGSVLTTGFQTILLLKLLNGYERMTIYGFDGYENEEKSILRTDAGEKYPISKIHDYKLENKILQDTAVSVDTKNKNFIFYGNRTL
jgi:CMP-N-acetylneuraminic acid synthetase